MEESPAIIFLIKKTFPKSPTGGEEFGFLSLHGLLYFVFKKEKIERKPKSKFFYIFLKNHLWLRWRLSYRHFNRSFISFRVQWIFRIFSAQYFNHCLFLSHLLRWMFTWFCTWYDFYLWGNFTNGYRKYSCHTCLFDS